MAPGISVPAMAHNRYRPGSHLRARLRDGGGRVARAWPVVSGLVAFEYQSCIGTTKSEAVGHDAIQLDVIHSLSGDIKPRSLGHQFVNVGRRADKAILHHQ